MSSNAIDASFTKVAAVFATMNRREVAVVCVSKLSAQSRLPWLVVVADNASTDGTAEALESQSNNVPIDVLRIPSNLGNAGGVKAAMDHAFAMGADFVWILDDDSWPQEDALERLMEFEPDYDGVRSSLVIDPQTDQLSWPIQIDKGDGRWRFVSTRMELPKDSWFRIRRSWLGSLIPKEIYESVGPVRADLFLRGEDEDYPRRIERQGCMFFIATNSILHHPSGGRLGRIGLFGHSFVMELGLPPLKLYYRVRNRLWICREEKGEAAALVLLVVSGLQILLREPQKWKRLSICKDAARDAWTDKLGISEKSY